MARLLSFLAFCALTLTAGLSAQTVKEPPTGDAVEIESRELTYIDSIVLGLVEGITEYLPVSSTGHLILTNAALGLDVDTPVYNKAGELIMVEGDNGELRAYTTGDAAYAYVIVIQAGAIIAIVLMYWQRILDILRGMLGQSKDGRKLAINLLAAFIPAAIIGLLLNDLIESYLGDNIVAVAGALIVGAIAMLMVENWRKKRTNSSTKVTEDGPDLHEIPVSKAVLIGIFQCFAMWPGTSRSMATIIGGYVVGFTPAKAAEFSFLLGLITLTAASAYTMLKDGSNMIQALSVGPVLVGCLVAFVSAALAVRWLVGYLSKHGLAAFAWYRIVLAIAVLLFLK